MFLMLDGPDPSTGRGPYDDFWYGPLPGKTSSGVRINDETALRLAILYACVNVIAQDIAKVPLAMYRRKPDGGRVRVTDHPAVKLLRKPTRHLTEVEWREQQQGRQLMRGNAYCHMRTNFRGQVVDLHPWDPDLVRVEVMADDSIRWLVRDSTSGAERVYVEGEVMHLKGLALKGPIGLSPIDQQRESLGESVAAQAYAATFFANDARPNIWLEHPTHFKDESVRKEWLRAFKQQFGGGNRFSAMLTEYGIKVNQLPAVNHSDLQFIELRKMKANEICSIYRVPPHKVGILDRSTNNNIEHQGIEYVTDCLLTWCRRWEERLAEDLLSESERDEYYFEFTLDALMRGDAKSRNEAYQSGIMAGWLTRNEVRQRENLDKLPDLDEPLQPVNYVPAGTDPNAPKPEDASPADEGAAEDDAQQARGRSLELQARRRVLNRETRALTREWERAAGNAAAFADGVTTFYKGHLAFVAEALAISRGQAELYCMAQCDAIGVAVEKTELPRLLMRWEVAAEALIFAALPTEAQARDAAAEERERERSREAQAQIAATQRAAQAIEQRPPAVINVPQAAPPVIHVPQSPAPVVTVPVTVQPAPVDRGPRVISKDEKSGTWRSDPAPTKE
jgi:HK97 family phage portal protein